VAHAAKLSFILALALAAAGTTAAWAQEHEAAHGGGPAARPPARPAAHGEPHEGPHNYQRVAEPHGWNNRPPSVDRGTYQHNFQAARSFHVGVYHRPPGWVAHRWGYGQILPRAYWAPAFILGDYWLFALETPPAGYEWVRDDTDAILVNINTGEILQVEYGVFS
jgi:predicted ribosomally synthesized peptide with SipW-like signal peptide